MSRVALILAAAALAGFTDSRPLVRSIGPLIRTVTDLARAEAFYCTCLDFRVVGRPAPHTILLRLGDEILELRAGAPDTPAAANDPHFQHIAIVVADMGRAYARIAGARPISQGGPQILPGGLHAYKFRDPDGHPLELLQFPPGQGRRCWQRTGDARLFRGIDHTAITVRDTGASLRFWRDGLGLRVTSRGTNRGPAQQALDGVFAPFMRVTQLAAGARGMRLELLQYLHPPPGASARVIAAADELLLNTYNIATLARRLKRHGVIADGAPGRRSCADPDGHRLVLQGI